MLVEHCQYTCPGGWEMRRVRSTLSDSDNIAISVQVQLELDLPTGTELGNKPEIYLRYAYDMSDICLIYV